MFEFKGISFESIKLKVGSLIGRVFHKEEHNENILNVDVKKTEVIGTQIGQQQIAQQVVLHLPEGLPQGDQAKFVKAIFGGSNLAIEAPVSTEASGDAQLPTTTTSSPAETFLNARYEEYLANNTVLLDRGGLLVVYKEREKISFTQEQLVFLTQSSFKNDFPAWFWMFNHREKFEGVVPLLQKVFEHPLQKVRRGVITALTGFIDTGDEIFNLVQSEPNAEVIGFAVSKFFEKGELDRAQRVISNALTRKIIPILTEKGEKKVEQIKIDLGSAERRYLHGVIENGWPSEKLKALRILSFSAEENDLPFLEKMLTKTSYANIVNLVLASIARIGKTSQADYIEKELLETRWEESFIAHLDALIGVKHKAIFPKLLEWLGDIDKVTVKFWRDEINERKLEERIQGAIVKLLDKDTYELLVEYIVSKYSPDTSYGNIMSWRHFKALQDGQSNPEIATLLKAETRLSKFERWSEMTQEIALEERTATEDPEKLLASVSPQQSKEAFLALRKLYTLISPEDTVTKVSPIIKQFRENLETRLGSIASGEHSEEVKELAKNELEKFLGDNRYFYRLERKRKKNSRYDTEGEEDKEFDTLSKDIENFSIIEKEYFGHIFKTKIPEIKTILMDSIGRPYESIYDSITKDTEDKDALGDKLIEVIRTSPNPLIRLKAIEALFRLDVANNDVLRAITLTILVESRDNVKASRGMRNDSDDWFTSEIAYLWAVNALIEFCNPVDFTYIQEATNREKILARSYHRYSNFFDYKVIEELLDLSENLEEQEEKENALSALNSLDYAWTKKVLGIEK